MRKPILGAVLKQLRETQGWTLSKLAEQCRIVGPCKVSVDSLSRIENGKQSGNRTSTREALAKALRVEPEVLTGERTPPPRPKEGPQLGADTGEYQINVRVDGAVRNAFSLAALRYRIRPARMIELAPLLFVLAAEHSLERRRAKLRAVEEAFDRAEDAAACFPHLPKTIAPALELGDAIRAERDSIARRDLLAETLDDHLYQLCGTQKDDYDPEQDNPFVANLKEEATEPDIAAITCFSSARVDFEVCRGDALKLVGGDERLAAGILEGWAPLHEMPNDLQKGFISAEAPEEPFAWLRAKADEHDAAMAELDAILFDFDGPKEGSSP